MNELQRNIHAEIILNQLIPKCCNGNADAHGYLKKIFFIVRNIDDLQDEDTLVKKEDLMRGYFYALADFTYNPFYRKHQELLTGIQTIAFNAWEDSNIWSEDTNPTKRLYAHVIRDYIIELFILVAYLTGGRKLMREVSLMAREIFLEDFKGDF